LLAVASLAAIVAVSALPTPDDIVPETKMSEESSAAAPAPPCSTELLTRGKSGKTIRCSGPGHPHHILYDITVPSHCTRSHKCGVIINTHGQENSAESHEAHTGIKAAALKGKKYIVINPEDPTTLWGLRQFGQADESKAIGDFVFNEALDVYKDVVDFNRIHTTGFSAGAILSYDLLCRYSEKICSTAGIGFNPQMEANIHTPHGWVHMSHLKTCFNLRAGGKGPKHKRSLMVHTNTVSDPYFEGKASNSFNNAVHYVKTLYGIEGDGEKRKMGAGVDWTRYKTKTGVTFEAANYKYTNPSPKLRGHCIVAKRVASPLGTLFCGPDSDDNMPQYTWGDEVLKFFEANPCVPKA